MKKEKKDASAIFIPAGLLIGMGFGFIFDNVPAGMFIGLGLGMAAWTLTLLISKKGK